MRFAAFFNDITLIENQDIQIVMVLGINYGHVRLSFVFLFAKKKKCFVFLPYLIFKDVLLGGVCLGHIHFIIESCVRIWPWALAVYC